MNRIILDTVRCMLTESGLSKRFWAEATNLAIYLINRSPSSALNFKTLMLVSTGTKPNLNYLKSFGSLAYIHSNQGKLNPRVIKEIFIGYLTGVKGYKIWLIDEKKCAISRNIVFHELTTLKTNLQDQIPLKTDGFWFDVESTSGHHSQDLLDETDDQGNDNSRPHLRKTPSSLRS